MVIAPMFRILRVAIPFIGNTDAASEPDFSIDNQQFAMGAIVDAEGPVPKIRLVGSERIVFGDFNAGLFHELDGSVIELACALPIENDVHCDMGARPLGQ